MKKNKFLFAAMLCVALVFGFSACENPDANEELLNRIEQLENELKNELNDLKNDKDKTDSADKGGDKDNSSDNEQNGEETPEPETPTSGTENGYDYVDLGLSVKWATCNVGATKPEEYGNYYAWGETTPKSIYNSSTYYYSGGAPTTLPLNRDAVAVNWGGNWRMPTIEEKEELIDECTWTWTTLNGVNGYNVEGPNGNAIFLPAAGYRYVSYLDYAGSVGYYWSSSRDSDDSYFAYYLSFGSGSVYWTFEYYGRYYGRSVRGVFSE